jgi:predicted RNA binding protein YcfA (HicA-like mRNA interferase family)
VSRWPSTKARGVLAAFLRLGRRLKRQSGAHRSLERKRWPDVVFAFHTPPPSARARQSEILSALCEIDRLPSKAHSRTAGRGAREARLPGAPPSC